MGLDSEHAVEGAPEQCADDALRDRFAGAEHPVLAHIRQVRRDQGDAPRAGPADGVARQQNLDELGVRIMQRAHQNRFLLAVPARAHQAFAIGKAMHGQASRVEPGCCREPPRETPGVGKKMNASLSSHVQTIRIAVATWAWVPRRPTPAARPVQIGVVRAQKSAT